MQPLDDRQLDVRNLQDFVRQLGPDQTPVLLDVREPWERALARLSLPGTTPLDIPMQSLPTRLGELGPTQPILVLCHHGMRSQQCVAFLLQQGRANTYNISGGIDAWSRLVDATVPRY